MKKILLTISLVLVAIVGKSQGLEDIIVEKYYVSNAADNAADATLPIGSTTYRIYVDLKPGYKFLNLQSSPKSKIIFSTSTTFWNSSLGSVNPANSLLFSVFPTLALDSWLSFGQGAPDYWGIKKSDDTNGTILNHATALKSNDSNIDLPLLTVQDGLLTGTPPSTNALPDFNEFSDGFGKYSTSNLISASGTSIYGELAGTVGPDDKNRILVAQVTVSGNGTFNFSLGQVNIQNIISKEIEGFRLFSPVNVSTQVMFKYPALSFPRPSFSFPTITIDEPVTNGDTYPKNANLPIKVSASDADGTISRVVFTVNSDTVFKDTEFPYEFNYTTPDYEANQLIKVIAYDNDTLVGIDTLRIKVSGNVFNENLFVPDVFAFNVYPNPVSNILNVKADLGNSVNDGIIAIYNIHGSCVDIRKIVNKTGIITEGFDVSTYPKGQYMIEFKKSGIKSVKRFIKL